ncbi:N-acetylmuramoyl-L-alanine amidase [uncultured Modestobacter sp.]|uniref:N-acetylmuramoyl-L-alanine amidase n=1 Tax=uncultured Modestobacter sp. TaxID=380048 RepID=UPI002628E8A3|nr:N-acetylmuramoyl-L-alanine amidase [uncultured Modestobacter sp.]
MQRFLVSLLAFLALTGTVLILPVYAAPSPAPEPVTTSADVVEMGSVEEPAVEADVQPGTTEPVGGVPADEPALTVSDLDTPEFSLVGVTWAYDPAVTDTLVQVRVRDADGAWGGWTEVTVEDADQDESAGRGSDLRGGTSPLWTGPSTGVEAELVTRSGAEPTDVQLHLVDPGASEADAALAGPDITDTAEAADTMPAVYSRAQWGANEAIRTWDPEYAPTIKAATLHHTADSNDYSADQVPAIMRSIYQYHTVSRGWGDIGYNVIADKFGRLWEGRYGGLSSTVVGAHAGGFNTGTFGVSMLGNYETAPTTPAMISAVADIIAWKFSLYGVNPTGRTTLTSGGGGTARYPAGTAVSLPTIFGHRDVGTTSCPGLYGYAQLGTVRALTAQRVGLYSQPQGSLDVVSGGIRSLSVSGWAWDGDAPTTSLTVHVYVDGKPMVAWTAGRSRPDVAAAYPGAGSAHGYSGTLTASAGDHQVCVYAINRGPGSNAGLGCRTVTVAAPNPVPKGAVDERTVFGDRLLVRGWALDEDSLTTPLMVHVYVDGKAVKAVRASTTRSDIGRAFPGAGTGHGFSTVVDLALGSHTVCVYAVNVGAGSVNPSLGCGTVVRGAAASNPVGALTAATVSGRTATVTGWAVDPDALTGSTRVHVYVDGVATRAVTAGARTATSTLLTAFGAGTQHGFSATLTLGAGSHTVCAFAINSGAGAGNPSLGCRPVTVAAAAWNPAGSLDAVTLGGDGRTASVRGWALDHDAPLSPTAVHVYVDGVPVTAVRTGATRADVASAFPGTGSAHGFSTSTVLTAGVHRVCAFAINTGQGSGNPSIGCASVTVAAAAYDPVGSLDEATLSGTTLTVRGWAADPDQPTAPVRVHLYVDGVATFLTADAHRPDVAAVYPAFGAGHGYQSSVTVAASAHRVCAYAINVGVGTTNTTLGCRDVG